RIAAGLDLRDLTTTDGSGDQVDPASVADWPGITVSAVVRDARGMLHRFAAPHRAPGGTEPAVIELGSDRADGDRSASAARFAYPLDLVAVEVGLSLPPDLTSHD